MKPEYIILHQKVSELKKQRSRELRQQMTKAEAILWAELRGNKLGQRFRRQQVIRGFIVDFYCHSAGLAFEIDGDIHEKQLSYDEARDKLLLTLGLKCYESKMNAY